MKRDWEIIREVLQKVEDSSDTIKLKDFSEDNAEKYSYHVELLIESELIAGEMESHIGCPVLDFNIERLTWAGHDFLDAVSNNSIWNKTKKVLKEKGLGMSFDIIKKTAIKFAEEML